MMRTIFKVFLVTCITGIASLSAQNSAQAQDFVDFGNGSASRYNRRMEKDIPICTINEFGFNINIGLHYSSQGFQPAKRESEVGHNWFLNTGGAITRTVNGVEDELRDDRNLTDGDDNPINLDGYYTGIKKHHPTKTQIMDRSVLNVHDNYYHVGTFNDPYEVNPDEFQFNFGGGISGKFFIDLDGSAKVVPNGPYHLKVDLSGFAEQRSEKTIFDPRKPADSQIIITADNGYKYYFGGNYNNLQWNTEDSSFPLQKRPVITTWNLTRIVAPNGNTVVYEYHPFDIAYINTPDSRLQKVDESVGIFQNTEGLYPEIPNKFDTASICTYREATAIPRKYIKRSNLKSITIHNTINIQFQYSNLENVVGAHDGHKLDRIDVSGVGIPAKSAVLGYDLYNKRPFLKSIKINNEEPYVFEYELNNSLPDYDSFHRNQFGYYEKGAYSRYNHYGYGHRYNINYDSSIPYEDRQTNNDRICYFIEDNIHGAVFIPSGHISVANLAHIGLLKKITLPTKGSIVYHYQNRNGKKQPKVEPIQIDKIVYDDNKGNKSTIVYRTVSEKEKIGLTNLLDDRKSHNAIEKLLPNGSSVISIFDVEPSASMPHQEEFSIAATGEYSLSKIPVFGSKSSAKQTKLIATLQFDAEGKPVSKTRYFYTADNDPQHEDSYIPQIVTHKGWGKLYKLYDKPNFLSERRTYTYDEYTDKFFKNSHLHQYIATTFTAEDTIDVKLHSVARYTYDTTYHKIKEGITYTDHHQKQKTTYTYPYEYSTSNPVINKMVVDNILPQISKKSTIENKGTTYALGTSVSEFKIHNNMVVPSKSYQWSPAPNTESLTLAGTQLGVSTTGQVQTSDPEHLIITTYDQYSNQGVPYEVSTNRNTSGYTFYTPQDRKPFLVISNITHAALTAIPASGGAASNVIEALQQINTDQQQVDEVSYLIDYLTEHYPYARCAYTNYDVNTGLVKFTMDSRKQKTFFEYDDRHRLTITKDNEGNIINHTLYNTKK
ncbi:hypothetical protein [Aquimarina algiphila]|uniref:RHS repeat protein n=1 Tax=Aquimarina algiphila TaxID=2047982 RepID=A0A554VM73_9FLAO|nr:hypothetical protein [Aquimarina algiphila]TSE09322.1 hypothetical protein FOF46_08680 [Aquimarina algiphila]